MTDTTNIPNTVEDVIASLNQYAAERPTSTEWRHIWRPLLVNAQLGAVGEELVIEHLVLLNVGGKRALSRELKEFRERQAKTHAAGEGFNGKPDKYVTLVSVLRDDRAVLPVVPQFNTMSQSVEFGGTDLADVDVLRLRERLGVRGTGFSFGKDDIFDALLHVAHEKEYHPVQQYLTGLAWDGVSRLNAAAAEYLGDCNTLGATMVRRWFISAVARALKPGCKVDTALILIGAQGVKKSTFFKVLAGPWFSDTAIDLGDKDSYALLRRAWIFEWAELESMQRARSQNTVKAFLSSQEDTYRPPYGRVPVTVQRSGVVVGTTNDEEVFTDQTGNRRYQPVPVSVKSIDSHKLALNRDQLWAEAVVAFKKGEQWWLTATEDAALEERLRKYTVGSPWEDRIRMYLDGKIIDPFSDSEPPEPLQWVTATMVLDKAIGKPVGQQTKRDEMTVAAVMSRLGWEKAQRGLDGDRRRGYARPAAPV